jgi:hypothetical protein
MGIFHIYRFSPACSSNPWKNHREGHPYVTDHGDAAGHSSVIAIVATT